MSFDLHISDCRISVLESEMWDLKGTFNLAVECIDELEWDADSCLTILAVSFPVSLSLLNLHYFAGSYSLYLWLPCQHGTGQCCH